MFSVTCSNLKSILVPSKKGDVGFDLIAASDPIIIGEKATSDSPYYESIDFIEYEVDLKIDPPEGYYSLVYPRSSLSNYNLQFCNSVGVIDNGYRGKIKVRFNYIWQPKHLTRQKYIKDTDPDFIYENFLIEIDYSKIYKKGDKIAQMVFNKSYIPELKEGKISETERSDSGFGSSGN